ncbi:hypothetical protein FGG08_003458 [Glutinoglossum americanum]|uniref:Transmembrane protein UsgS n=1 Tax=Glutinoglossum americanum TaxID=1670608 RepID=A0A9P8L0K3_9PEZI|nr:hypothetical protein FGG08_003458 [Glutinoglossum americanum]
MIRGAQLTVVGGGNNLAVLEQHITETLADAHSEAHRALQNPGLFKYKHYRQAAVAVVAGVVIRLAIAAPIIGVKVLLWLLSFFLNEQTTWNDNIISGLGFIENSVLQVPFFLMSLMRYITPTLDEMFMDSLQWVDGTYIQKHKSEDPKRLRSTYYPNLQLYPTHGDTSSRKSPLDRALAFVARFGKRAGISLLLYIMSYLPVVGRFVLPAASFYTFNKAVGPAPAAVVFGGGLFLPRKYLVVFLQSYFSSRSLMRELLEPYFSRIRFSREQKAKWFRDREGLLFGFGVGFYLFLKIPLLGVLVYGIAEASTAYLITKITDAPPPPSESEGFVETQIQWRNKSHFLRLPLASLDVDHASTEKFRENPFTSAGKDNTR